MYMSLSTQSDKMRLFNENRLLSIKICPYITSHKNQILQTVVLAGYSLSTTAKPIFEGVEIFAVVICLCCQDWLETISSSWPSYGLRPYHSLSAYSRLLPATDRIQSLLSPCGGQSGTVAGWLILLRFPLPVLIHQILHFTHHPLLVRWTSYALSTRDQSFTPP
jgi:hypothetical protein